MDEINALAGIDFKGWLLTLFIILFGIAAVITVVEKVSAALGKPVKWIKSNSKDHEMIMGVKESIDALAESNRQEDERIEALGAGMIELLGSEFDRKFSHFIAIGGIPENELSVFTATFKAYERLGGNHRRKEKYLYAIKRLDVLPVTTTVDLETEGGTDEEEQT
ncbi:MAG: hypothetical protein LUE96_07255 [Lachnospiraceae bacterium]|nr:hypothetical protein [Lachnospiraceae bacterium]